MAIKLTYFGIEGAAEPVRLAMVLAGVDFEDERITFADWPALKPKTKFGQLPVMKSGDKPEIAQSGAMLRMVGKVHGKDLYPQEGDAFVAVEEAMGLVDDFAKAWSPCLYISLRPQAFGYPEDYAKTDEGKAKIKSLREGFVKDTLPTFMKHFATMIEANSGFLVGGKPTIADCLLLPSLRKFTKGYIDDVPATCLEAYPAITAYIARMMELPAIKAWYEKH